MSGKHNRLLTVILIVHIAVCVVFFSCFKQGYHSDETWSFGLANSIGQPHFTINGGIYLDYASASDWDNYNEWITGKTYNDYITVQKGEQFDLIGVYKNMTLDHHPFLFFWFVNAVCSLFPDKFSFWYVFVLQMGFLVVTQVFLYKIGEIIFKEKKWTPLILCLFYAVGRGGMVTFSFIRQYSLLTTLVVMHFYFQLKLFTSENFDMKKYMFPVALTALMGLLTHYYMVSVTFGTTLMICIYLLFKKRIKKMFAYGFSMVGVIIAFLIIWPSSLLNLKTGNGSYNSYPMETQLKMAFSDLLKSVCGLEIDPMRSYTHSYVIAFIVLASAVILPLCFLFRNEEWFQKFISNSKKYIRETAAETKNEGILLYFFLTILVITIIYLIVLAKTVDIFRMGESYTRYMFPLMPLICLALVGFLEFVIIKIPLIKKNSCVPCIGLFDRWFNLLTGSAKYFYIQAAG